MAALNEAYAHLANLSDERAQRVVSLIEDLARLEALENAEDLAEAREVLTHPEPVSWRSLKAELDESHG